MSLVNHTIKLDVVGMNGIAICGEDTDYHSERMETQVSSIVCLCRDHNLSVSEPSRPITSRISKKSKKGHGRVQNGGSQFVRHMALWGKDKNGELQAQTLTMPIKLRQISKSDQTYKSQLVEIAVGIVCGEETILLGISSINLVGPVPMTQLDLPIFPVGSKEANDIINETGLSKSKGIFNRSKSLFSIHEKVFNNSPYSGSQRSHLMKFKSDDIGREYKLDPGASIRVQITVEKKKQSLMKRKKKDSMDILEASMTGTYTDSFSGSCSIVDKSGSYSIVDKEYSPPESTLTASVFTFDSRASNDRREESKPKKDHQDKQRHVTFTQQGDQKIQSRKITSGCPRHQKENNCRRRNPDETRKVVTIPDEKNFEQAIKRHNTYSTASMSSSSSAGLPRNSRNNVQSFSMENDSTALQSRDSCYSPISNSISNVSNLPDNYKSVFDSDHSNATTKNVVNEQSYPSNKEIGKNAQKSPKQDMKAIFDFVLKDTLCFR